MEKKLLFLLFMVSLFMCTQTKATVMTYNGWAGDNDNITSFTDGAGENYGSRISSSPVAYTGDAAISAVFEAGNGWTPNVVVAWEGGQPNNWDTYTGWRGEEVAQIQGSSPGNSMNVVFTPDAGYGVLINSFDLDEWAGGGDIVVDWEVLDDTGILASGTWTGNDAGTRSTINTGLTIDDMSVGKVVTLRFMQTAGDDTYLAMDDTNFDQFIGEGAGNLSPADGSMLEVTWVTLSWHPGKFAASHDVYVGDNFDDVNNATRDSDVFRVNQALNTTFYFTGFAPGAYPDGLVPGTTYYWRIDEINDAEPNSPWKGDVWSFSIATKTAYFPDPADGAEFVDLNVALGWTAGFEAKMHYIVFGEDYDEVNNTAMGVPNGTTNYTPGPLKLAKTYYWRVDEFDGSETYKGEVWSFTTEGAVGGPNPADGAVDVSPSVLLSWDAGAVAASHEVYFGTDADTVANATSASPEYKGPKALGDESYDPGKLMLNSTYYWRIDEVNGINPDSPWAGKVWSFTTGDFLVIDDFESYDAEENQIWWSWKDGLGYVAHGNESAYPGNGTSSAVGDETTASYTEETVVHGGLQSMPLLYDNNKQGFANYSEADLTLTGQRDWTEQGVAELSLWFRGNPASVGSFIEGPAGTYTMTGSGADIWYQSDEFHYAYKTLSGTGSIVAKVESIDNTHVWAKAGVMIRESLEPGSKYAFACITPGSGASFQYRLNTDDDAASGTQAGITAPYWVKVERSISGSFSASTSTNGSTWVAIENSTPQVISMSSNVYVGLALTSHDDALTCTAKLSNVQIVGTIGPMWTNQDIGIASNDAEQLYVAVSNSAGAPAVFVHDDPAAAQIDEWTEWIIPLQALADQGITLTDVDSIAIGLGTKGNMTVPGGSGKMYFDDIRLYRPRDAAAE